MGQGQSLKAAGHTIEAGIGGRSPDLLPTGRAGRRIRAIRRPQVGGVRNNGCSAAGDERRVAPSDRRISAISYMFLRGDVKDRLARSLRFLIFPSLPILTIMPPLAGNAHLSPSAVMSAGNQNYLSNKTLQTWNGPGHRLPAAAVKSNQPRLSPDLQPPPTVPFPRNRTGRGRRRLASPRPRRRAEGSPCSTPRVPAVRDAG